MPDDTYIACDPIADDLSQQDIDAAIAERKALGAIRCWIDDSREQKQLCCEWPKLQ